MVRIAQGSSTGQPSWLADVRYNSERNSSRDHFTKDSFQWSEVSDEETFYEFCIGSYDTLSCLGWRMCSTDKILIEDLLGTISTRSSANGGSTSSQEDLFTNFSKLSLAGGGILVCSEVIDKIMKESKLGIIPPKFGSNWASRFQTYTFFLFMIFHRALCKTMFGCGGRLCWLVGSSDIIMKGTNIRPIPP